MNVLNGSVTLQLSYKVLGQETIIHRLRILPRYALEFLAVLDATAEHIGALRQQGRLFHVDDHKPPHDDVTVVDIAQPIPADKGTVHVALLLTRGRHGTIRLRLRGESQYGGKSGSDDGYLTDERLDALRSALRAQLV